MLSDPLRARAFPRLVADAALLRKYRAQFRAVSIVAQADAARPEQKPGLALYGAHS